MWNTLLVQPIFKALIFLYSILGQNLGLAIIALTLIIRGLLTPLTLPSLKLGQKMKQLQPELDKLKAKYGANKQEFAKKQLELYQSHGLNPAAGCLPQIIQLVILIALYQVFQNVLNHSSDYNPNFLYLDLTKPDLVSVPAIKIFNFVIDKLPGPILILAAATQFFSSKLMMPSFKKTAQIAQKTPDQADDLAASMQTQTLYLFPLMTLFIGFSFPSGLVLYWLVFSAFMLAQQIIINYYDGKKD